MSRPRLLPPIAGLLAAACMAGAGWAQTPIPPPANDFAMMSAQSDAYEIQAGRDAAVQGVDPRIRSFGEQMVADHTRSSEALRQAAVASGLPPPPDAMGPDQARMLSALQSLRGPDFDRAYAKQQALAHHQALAVQQSYAAAGGDPNLRRAAQQAVPMIQQHLQMAEQLRSALGGS